MIPKAARQRRSFLLVIVMGALAAASVSTGCNRNPAVKAEKYFIQGQELAKQGKENEAIIMYRRALQTYPSLTKARLELANLYISKGEFLSAYKEVQLVLKADP